MTLTADPRGWGPSHHSLGRGALFRSPARCQVTAQPYGSFGEEGAPGRQSCPGEDRMEPPSGAPSSLWTTARSQAEESRSRTLPLHVVTLALAPSLDHSEFKGG